MSKIILIVAILAVGWWGGIRPLKFVKEFTGFEVIRPEGTGMSQWKEMTIGEIAIKVQIRDTAEGRRQGLSGYESLGEDEGMLFVFPVEARYSFWMKGMKFDLDVLWIKDGEVIGIVERVRAPRAGESPIAFGPESAVNEVLEVKSGWVKKNGIKVGDKIKY